MSVDLQFVSSWINTAVTAGQHLAVMFADDSAALRNLRTDVK